jgi:hypothetical protein
MSDAELMLQRAIATISQCDPLIKLLEQVRLGRMKPSDAGLHAIMDSWLATYLKAVESPGLTRQALLRIDPTPRVAVLTEQGVLPQDHAGVKTLLAHFEQAMNRAIT